MAFLQNCDPQTKVRSFNPLLISEIVKSVLKKLPISDLQTCRFVNLEWNDQVERILLKREDDIFIKISSVCKPADFEAFCESQWIHHNNFKLDASKICELRLMNSFRFHCLNVKKLVVTNVCNESIKKDLPAFNTQMMDLFWFIFHDIPQVEYLEMDCGDSSLYPPNANSYHLSLCWRPPTTAYHPQLQLSKLKVFSLILQFGLVHYFSPFICGVMGAARNLREVNIPLSLGVHICSNGVS